MPQVRVEHELALEVQEQVLAVRLHARTPPAGQPLGPAVAGDGGLRSEDLVRHARRRAPARCGSPHGGSCRPRASGAQRQPPRPAWKPSSTSAGASAEPTIGSPSTLSSARRSTRPRLTLPRRARRARLDRASRGRREVMQPAAAALDVEHRLAADEHHVRAGDPRGAAARRAPGRRRPRQHRPVRLRRVDRGEHERRRRHRRGCGAQALDRARQRELGAAEPLDEVAATATPSVSSARARRRASRSRRRPPRPAPARG